MLKELHRNSSLKYPQVGKGTKIFPSAVISPQAVIGTNCKISSKAYIGYCKIGNNVKVGFNTSIYNGVKIGDNTIIEKNVIIFPGITIGKYCILENNSSINSNIGNNVKVGANSYVK